MDRLLEADFSSVLLQMSSVLRDPASNVTMFVLMLAAGTILLLLVIIGLILLFSRGGEYEEYEVYDDEYDEEPVRRREPLTAEEREELAARRAAELEGRRRARLVSSALWAAVSIAVLMAGGYVSSRNTVCTSCHVQGAVPHTARMADPATDPHGEVLCASCHESSNQLVLITLAVPGRALHYVTGAMEVSLKTGYGAPITNRSCAGCHGRELANTTKSSDRGLRMSHVEPLAANARCDDCHEMDPGTGIVNRYIVGMEPCMRCHDQQTASAECSYCHEKDISYALRSRTVLEPQVQVVDLSCGGCHSQEPCDACHGIRMPHTAEFKGLGHAREGVEDLWYNNLEVCKRCHTDTRRPCIRCHTGPFPGHPPNYMRESHGVVDPYNNGCDQCHWKTAWIRGRNFCGVCHEQYSTLDPGRTPNQ
jgi:hypothetical protein